MVQASLATTKPGVMCNQMISVAVATIEGLLKTDKGRKQLKATFQYVQLVISPLIVCRPYRKVVVTNRLLKFVGRG